MERTFRYLSVTLSLFVFLGVDKCPDITTNPPKEPLEVTLLHTNDIHSHLIADHRSLPGPSETNPFKLGGLAKLKTLVDQVREQKKNTLLLDAGDWSEGSLFYLSDAGTTMLRIFDAIGYDAAVIGNHDFYNGPFELLYAIERASPKFAVLGANTDLVGLGPYQNRFEDVVVPSKIFTLGEPEPTGDESNVIRVGVIGLLPDDFTFSHYFKPAFITSLVESASKIAKKMYEDDLADVIVLLSHNAFETNIRLAKQVPYVNAIISGHSHVRTPKPSIVSNAGHPVYVVEAGKWGQFLGDLTLIVDKEKKLVTLKDYTLRPVVQSLPDNPQVAAIVNSQMDLLNSQFGMDLFHDHVTECFDEMPQNDNREMVLGNMAADAYRLTTGADVGLESNATVAVGVSAGPLSLMDVFNIAPYIYSPSEKKTWTVQTIPFRGAALELAINFVLLAQKLKLGIGWISTSGLQVVYGYKDNSLLPVEEIYVHDPVNNSYQVLDDTKTYTVALHDGLIKSLELLSEKFNLDLGLSKIRDTGVQTWQSILELAKSRNGLKASDYESGTRYIPLEWDLGFQEHHISLVPHLSSNSKWALKIKVHNYGLSPSPQGVRLKVFRSPVNDGAYVFDGRGLVQGIGAQVILPAIAAQSSYTVEYPWLNFEGPGLYSLQVAIEAEDALNLNHSVVRHLKIPH